MCYPPTNYANLTSSCNCLLRNDAVVVTCLQLIDLLHDVSKLGTKEISLELRVVFRLDLPIPATTAHAAAAHGAGVKALAVKAPCQRQVRAALAPVLRRYGLDPTQLRITEVSQYDVLLSSSRGR